MNYEKVSVNIDDKKLSKIDLLVENGFYANRSDFINQATQELLDKEDNNIEKILEQNSIDNYIINDNIWFVGASSFDKEFLERVKALDKKINVKGFGVLSFNKECNDELIISTVETISKKIKIIASDKVKEYFGRK